jgi:hypothetical protein
VVPAEREQKSAAERCQDKAQLGQCPKTRIAATLMIDRSAHSPLKARAFGAPPGGIELDRSGDRATNALLLRHYTIT